MPESKISLPADVSDPVSLRRTLSAIVNELGLITGSKGVDPYVKESELPSNVVTLNSLDASIEEIKKAIKDVEDSVEEAAVDFTAIEEELAKLSNVTEYDQAVVAMLDFDDSSWDGLQGLYQLSDLGENFTNPPAPLTTGVTYNVFAQSFVTLGSGVVQEVIIEDTTAASITVYKRAADSFAQAIINGWLNV